MSKGSSLVIKLRTHTIENDSHNSTPTQSDLILASFGKKKPLVFSILIIDSSCSGLNLTVKFCSEEEEVGSPFAVTASHSPPRFEPGSSHLECGDSWSFSLGLVWAAAGSVASRCDLRLATFHLEQDVGGVVVLVGMRVVIDEARATKASGKVADLHLILSEGHLWCSACVKADGLAVPGWLEDGRRNFFLASRAVHHGLASLGPDFEGVGVLPRFCQMESRSRRSAKMSGETLLRTGFESCMSMRVACWAYDSGWRMLSSLLGHHERAWRRSRTVESVHPGVGLSRAWRLEPVVLARHWRALLGHSLGMEL